MRLFIRAKGVELTRELRDHIEKRLRFAMSRFGERIRRVRVRLTDINGPRGGEDIECSIRATLAPRGVLTIDEIHSDPYAAVALASDRAGHRLSRHLDRLNMHHQRSRS